MRTCPTCNKSYPIAVSYCPHDGSALAGAVSLLGMTIDGKYRVEAVLGQGGMGAVYRATQLNLQRPVALKVVKADLLGRPALLEDEVEQKLRQLGMTIVEPDLAAFRKAGDKAYEALGIQDAKRQVHKEIGK